MPLIIIIFMVLFICTAILASLEMAISSVNKLRVKSKANKNNKKAIKVLKLLEDYDRTLTTIIVLNNIINIILPTISTIIFLKIFVKNPEVGVVLSTIVLTLLLLMFGEIMPKTYGKKFPERVLYAFVQTLDIVKKIFMPLTFLFISMNEFVKNKIFPVEEENYEVEEELLTMIEESSQDGALEQNEGVLLRNAIEFNDIRVDEILQPKNNMFMIELCDSNDFIFERIKKEKYSRIPVYKDSTDNVIGIISERDFLQQYVKNKNFKIKTILRDAVFIPDTLRISKLLPEMQKNHNHLAIVVDEYGTIQGLITVEDIIEELVGEIWDEHDEVVVEYKKISDKIYQVIGNMTIGDFNDLFESNDIDTETEDSTIAGYLLEKAEKIPEVGEIIEDEIFKFKILEVSSAKIQRIEVELKDEV